MLHAAWRVFSLSRGACMTWNVFRNGCRTLASEIIWVFHSPFFGSTLLWSRCMPCFEGLLFYDFGAGAQAVLLADAVLIPGLIRNSWDEKACCPFNFYECRPLLRRDVFNQTACICKLFFFACLNFNDHSPWEQLGKSDCFMGQVKFVFSSLLIAAKVFCIHFRHCPGQPWLACGWDLHQGALGVFVRRLPCLIYLARS